MSGEAAVAAANALDARAAGVRRVIANALSLLLAYALPRAALVISTIVAARALGPAAFGAYGTAAAFAVILSIVSTLGMQTLLVREMARAPASAGALLRAAHRVKTVANAVMLPLLVMLAAGPLGYAADVTAAALMLGLAYAVGSYVENLAAYYQSVERMHVWTQASAAFGIVTAVTGIALVLATRTAVWYAASPIAGQVVALAWLHTRLPAHVRRARPAALTQVAALGRALAPFAAAFIALTLYYKTDVLLLAAWRSAEQVGIHAAAYRFVDMAQALVIVAAAAVYPRLARSAPAAPSRGEGWAAGRVAELLLLAAAPAAVCLAFAREPVIRLLYGTGYAAAAPVLGILAFTTVPLAFAIFAGYALGAAGRMRVVALAYTAALAANIALNALLIPARGALGAALAMLVSETALALVLALVLHRATGARLRLRSLAAAVLALALGGCAALLPVAPLLRGALFAVVLAVAYAALGVLPAHERTLLVHALRRRPRP